MVNLKSPQGTVVTVSEEKAERLKQSGYVLLGSTAEWEEETPPKRRGRPRKTQASEED